MNLDYLSAQNFSVNTLGLFEIVEKFSENLFHLGVDDEIFGFTCFQLDSVHSMGWDAPIM